MKKFFLLKHHTAEGEIFINVKLTNINEVLDMGRKLRRDKSIAKIEAFFNELASK